MLFFCDCGLILKQVQDAMTILDYILNPNRVQNPVRVQIQITIHHNLCRSRRLCFS